MKDKPILLLAGDTRVLINGQAPKVACRIVSEELYQEMLLAPGVKHKQEQMTADLAEKLMLRTCNEAQVEDMGLGQEQHPFVAMKGLDLGGGRRRTHTWFTVNAQHLANFWNSIIEPQLAVDKYAILWGNPRTIEPCQVVDKSNVHGYDFRLELINPQPGDKNIIFRKASEVFSTINQAEEYLERMDMTAAH